ncbi:MAG: hypothetical protein GY903_25950 [Fuerstiella sp.]|nr:hypothetical protein [Fuerstiella sp.]MCP4857942.1 hypothetical protein [Fuerstiella sp.]
MFWLDFKQSIAYLDEAVALTPSPLSLTYRARSLALQAASIRGLDVEQSLKLIDQAVDDAETAMRLFRARRTGSDNHAISPAVQGTHLLVMIHAYDIYKQEKRHQEAAEALKRAEIHSDAISDTDQLRFEYVRAWKGFYQRRKGAQLEEQERYEQAEEAKLQAKELLGNTSFADSEQTADVLRTDLEDKEIFEMKRNAALKKATDREGSARQNFMIALLYLMSEDTEAGRRTRSTN